MNREPKTSQALTREPAPGAPEVSICIPAYNRPESLRQAIASVLAQTATDLELVVTDDSGSPQQGLIGEFDDARLRYHWNGERLGMSGNWQRALTLARGRFIGLLMDDDLLAPTFVERCLAAFADDRVGVVFTNHLFDDGERVVPRERLIEAGTYEDFLPLLLEHRPVAICATLMRRGVWSEVLPVPDLHTADMVLHVRAAQTGCAFHYIAEPLMTYRIEQGNLSGELGFREHEVDLWRGLEFAPGSAEEALRRHALAAALLSDAAGQMQQGRFAEAQALAQEAEALDLRGASLGWRARAIALTARSPIAMRIAVRLVARARALRDARLGR